MDSHQNVCALAWNENLVQLAGGSNIRLRYESQPDAVHPFGTWPSGRYGGEVSSHRDLEPAAITLSDEDRRLVAEWAADCAQRVLPLFEVKAPSDTRPREAIEGARAFALDGKRTAQLRSLALAAQSAAREVGNPVAASAARAAGLAAATPYTHALATPHQSKHVLGPAVYQVQARELAAGNDPSVGDEEMHWVIERASSTVREVVRRFPARSPGRTRLATLYYQLDGALRFVKPCAPG